MELSIFLYTFCHFSVHLSVHLLGGFIRVVFSLPTPKATAVVVNNALESSFGFYSSTFHLLFFPRFVRGFVFLYFSTKLVEFCWAYLSNFSTKLVEFYNCVVRRIKLIPLFHIPYICGTESLRLRECSLKVEAHLIDNARTPFLFGFSSYKVAPNCQLKSSCSELTFTAALICAWRYRDFTSAIQLT